MQRRTFVFYSVLGAASLYLPLVKRLPQHTTFSKVLAQPLFLSSCCDAKTIHKIGKSYQQQAAMEGEKLVQLLLTGPSGKTVAPSSDPSTIISFLQQKVQQDFEKGRTLVVDGWVLSTTEAQQCALFSLS